MLEKFNPADTATPHRFDAYAKGFSYIKNQLEHSDLAENEAEKMLLDIEQVFAEEGFYEENNSKILTRVFEDDALVCRSEKLSRVVGMFDGEDISIVNSRRRANMCRLNRGAGVRTAMVEGFNTDEVSGIVKTILVFKPDDVRAEPLSPDDLLWTTKPDTAEVSFAGEGEIRLDDVVLILMRWPAAVFPKHRLTQSEQYEFDNGTLQFVVRRYLDTSKVQKSEQ